MPRRTRRAAGGAVRGYGEQSSAARRAAVRLAAAALTAGAGDPLLRDRLEVTGADTIEDHLARELGRPVLVSLHLGPARANRKPVLQLLDPGGGTVGFAKVATTALGRPAGRRRDRDAAHARPGRPDPPDPAAGAVRPGPGAGWRSWSSRRCRSASRAGRPAARLAAATAEVAAVGGITTRRWRAATWPGCAERVAALPAGPARDGLAGALDALRPAGTELRIGAWHGDWTPWNTAVARGRRVLVWDWERFATGVPVGFDALHYDLQPRVASAGVDAAGAGGRGLGPPAPSCSRRSGVPAGPARGRRAALPGRDRRPGTSPTARPGGGRRTMSDGRAGCCPRWPPGRLAALEQRTPYDGGAWHAHGAVTEQPRLQRAGATAARTTGRLDRAGPDDAVVPDRRRAAVRHDVDVQDAVPAPGGPAGGAAQGRALLRHRLPARDRPGTAGTSRCRPPRGGRRGAPARLPITGESSPYYMFHPLAGRADRRATCPASSCWCCCATRSSGPTPPTPTRPPAASRPSRSSGRWSWSRPGWPARRRSWSPTRRTAAYSHQHHAYVARGRYAEQLERLEGLFGRDRLHVVDSQRFFTDPGAGLRRGPATSSGRAATPAIRRSSSTTPGRARRCRTRCGPRLEDQLGRLGRRAGDLAGPPARAGAPDQHGRGPVEGPRPFAC